MSRYRTEQFVEALKTDKPTGCPYCEAEDFIFHEDLRSHIESHHKDKIRLMLKSMTPVYLERLKEKCDPQRWAAGMIAGMLRDLPKRHPKASRV